MDKQNECNKNRALFIAKSFIPKDSISLYYTEICNGCKYKRIECLEFCYCQDGDNYKAKEIKNEDNRN